MKKVAVILSGCGVFDGSEIHEAVLTLHAIERSSASWHCFAPNVEQLHVINHISGEEMSESRNVLVESSRIARGNICDVATLNADDFDALIVPGGFGAAKNLTNFAVKGAQCEINPDVEAACKAFAQQGKPAGYICIAPTIIPLIYSESPSGTIGSDEQTASAFNMMGGEHVSCPVDQIVIDEKHNVVSTPAYMLAESISQVASGIDKLVMEVLNRA